MKKNTRREDAQEAHFGSGGDGGAGSAAMGAESLGCWRGTTYQQLRRWVWARRTTANSFGTVKRIILEILGVGAVPPPGQRATARGRVTWDFGQFRGAIGIIGHGEPAPGAVASLDMHCQASAVPHSPIGGCDSATLRGGEPGPAPLSICVTVAAEHIRDFGGVAGHWLWCLGGRWCAARWR